MRAIIDGKAVEFDKGTAWKALISQPGALGVSVGGSTLSLNAPAQDGAQAHALTYADEEGRRIYERTLQLRFLAAAQKVIPGRRVRFEHSFGDGVFVRLPKTTVCLLYTSPPQQGTWTALWCVGAALPLARLADEHLRAAGQGETALLSAFLRAVLLAASAFCGLAWMAGAAALCALPAMTLACAVAGRPFAVPNAAAVARMPVAALRALLCPCLLYTSASTPPSRRRTRGPSSSRKPWPWAACGC